MTHLTTAVKTFLHKLAERIPAQQILTDALSCHAYAHDASQYLLIPQAIVRAESEQDIISILQLACQYHVSITFRAAGTSLSGQAQTDSILLILGSAWRGYEVRDAGTKIWLQPGLIASEVNLFLHAYQRRIGPDPASIGAAKMGGIAANNASGMCCGISQNSYHTLAAMRVIFTDGSILDTEDIQSRHTFTETHRSFLTALQLIRAEILSDQALTTHIRNQYRLKNTVGYRLDAFLDFSDPIEILIHLLIGSEGTLGFIAAMTFHTVSTFPFEAAALIFFDDIATACQAALKLPQLEVAAIELMDEFSLKTAKLNLHAGKAALLVDMKACTEAELQRKMKCIDADFITDRASYQELWAIRRGILPIIAGARSPGASLINEDIAVFPADLPQFCLDLTQILQAHHYLKYAIFGHVKDGNLHFLFEANFNNAAGITQYHAFMQDLVILVTDRYQGALKAEHGTGRNMAPFVEKAWGNKAYHIMEQIKSLFDPTGILNPDVVLTKKADLHLQHLKPLPKVDAVIDRCIECGFCEKVCPSNKLTLTPRQRIVALRDMQRLKQNFAGFQYRGLDTCAATGLCKTVCPVGINIGDMVRKKRFQSKTKLQSLTIQLWLNHFATVMRFMRFSLKLLQTVKPRLPALHLTPESLRPQHESNLKSVWYFPSCGERLFKTDQIAVLTAVLKKLGYRLEILPGFENQCCGLMFKSKGYLREGIQTTNRLEKFLKSGAGRNTPILCEMGSCVLQMLHAFKNDIKIYDMLEFIDDQLRGITIKPLPRTVMLHLTCSIQHLGLHHKMRALAERCVQRVIIPVDIFCCGFAGEKGFTYPELNQSALSTLKSQIPEGCTEGYSMSLSCETGLSKAAGISYRSLIYLIQEALDQAS